MAYLHVLSVLFAFASLLILATNRLFDENIRYSTEIQHLANSTTFTVICFKNEAMSYLHGLSLLLCCSSRLFDVNTGYSAFQHLTKSAAFAVTRLKNEAQSYLHGLSVLFALWLVNEMQFHQLYDSYELTRARVDLGLIMRCSFHQLHDLYDSYELTRAFN